MEITMRDEEKIKVIQAVVGHKISTQQAGAVLQRSVRQVNRLIRRFGAYGIRGLIHGNRGKPSPRKITPWVRNKILALVRGPFADINDTQLSELLQREAQITIGRETLRAMLRQEKIPAKLQRRRRTHRRRRERKDAFGVMLQIDGSPHDWLEGRGPWLTLIGAKDDATSFTWAHFEAAETTWGYLDLLRSVFVSKGLPFSLYSDRHTIFHSPKAPTIVEQLQNVRPRTQFGRAMEELGITLIKAWSAPAKGRIENQWKTFQDRLVVELRLAGAKTQDDANRILTGFLKAYNQRFTVAARQREPVFRPAPTPAQLDRILCLKETRTVNKDHTISFEGLILQIPPSAKWRSIARHKVEVLQLRDGRVEIQYKHMTVATFSAQAITTLVEQHHHDRCQLKHAA